jgi:hypothetical protein
MQRLMAGLKIYMCWFQQFESQAISKFDVERIQVYYLAFPHAKQRWYLISRQEQWGTLVDSLLTYHEVTRFAVLFGPRTPFVLRRILQKPSLKISKFPLTDETFELELPECLLGGKGESDGGEALERVGFGGKIFGWRLQLLSRQDGAHSTFSSIKTLLYIVRFTLHSRSSREIPCDLRAILFTSFLTLVLPPPQT